MHANKLARDLVRLAYAAEDAAMTPDDILRSLALATSLFAYSSNIDKDRVYQAVETAYSAIERLPMGRMLGMIGLE